MATKKLTEEEIKSKIEAFILNNGLTFKEGRRNSDTVILSGYALYLGFDKSSSKLSDYIDNVLEHAEYTLAEFHNTFEYAKYCDYGNWWKKAENRKQYKV